MTEEIRTLVAIHANVGVEAWYRRQLESIVYDISRDVLRDVIAAYKAADPKIGFGHDASGPATLQKVLNAFAARWIKRLDQMADKLATQFTGRSFAATQRAMLQAFANGGWTVKFKPSRGSIAAYDAVIAENVGLIKSIPAQYLKDVQQTVWASVMKGGDLGALTKAVQEKFNIAHRRAALIARDQNNKAKALIENVRRRELGITEAVWQHSGGGKEPRPTHVAMDGHRYELAQGMWDEAEKAHVWPGELINCRCTSRAILPGFT